jgi:hypothetical protein
MLGTHATQTPTALRYNHVRNSIVPKITAPPVDESMLTKRTREVPASMGAAGGAGDASGKRKRSLLLRWLLNNALASCTHADSALTCAEPGPAVEGSAAPSFDPSQFNFNFPLPGETGPAVMVKLYNHDSPKIAQMVEVCRHLTSHPFPQSPTRACPSCTAWSPPTHLRAPGPRPQEGATPVDSHVRRLGGVFNAGGRGVRNRPSGWSDRRRR